MNKILKLNKVFLISIHVLLGVFGYLVPSLLKYIYLIIILFAILDIYRNQNKNEEALLWSSYMVGAEVFIRMIKATFSYETGKYSVFLFLLIGLLIGNRKQLFSLGYYFYIFLLLIGIVFTDIPYGESIRKAVAFNLSGPIVLGIAALYFNKRRITKKQLFSSLFMILLPLFSMVIYLYIKIPSIKEILFRGTANFETSGGFGPNQVATAIGMGVFILTIFLLLKIKLTKFVFLDALFLIYFIYRGLLTFSRGGMITGLIAIIAFIFFYLLFQKKTIQLALKYIFVGIIFSFAIWLYTSNATGGMLDNRYAGKNARGIKKDDISSGRFKVFEMQLQSFYDSPVFGIGAGSGKYKRLHSGEQVTAASHNEISRLLEEHGLIGVVILIILFSIPIAHMYQSNNLQRAFLISFFLFWLLTISHSAMRIAFPSFIYALSLIDIDVSDENA